MPKVLHRVCSPPNLMLLCVFEVSHLFDFVCECFPAENRKCHTRTCHRYRWIRIKRRAHPLISPIFLLFWKHQPAFSPCSLFTFNLPQHSSLWLAHPNHPSIKRFIYFILRVAFISRLLLHFLLSYVRGAWNPRYCTLSASSFTHSTFGLPGKSSWEQVLIYKLFQQGLLHSLFSQIVFPFSVF